MTTKSTIFLRIQELTVPRSAHICVDCSACEDTLTQHIRWLWGRYVWGLRKKLLRYVTLCAWLANSDAYSLAGISSSFGRLCVDHFTKESAASCSYGLEVLSCASSLRFSGQGSPFLGLPCVRAYPGIHPKI